MANTRDFKSLGIWAQDAVTPVPGFPTPGVAYRDDTLTEGQNKAGDPFDTIPDSAQFNQKMYTVTSFTDMLDSHGGLGWTNLVDYALPAIVWASDARFYQALQPSGPGTAPQDPVDEVDPINNPIYWEVITSASTLRRELADSTPGSEGARLVNYNKFDINGGIDTPLTVKEALDEGLTTAGNLNGLSLIMAGSFSGTTGIAIGNTFNVYQNKSFITVSPQDPNIQYYSIYPDSVPPGAPDDFFFAHVYVSVRAAATPALPVGNFEAVVPGVTKDSANRPGGGDLVPAIQIWQYPLDSTLNATYQQDFDVIALAIGDPGTIIN